MPATVLPSRIPRLASARQVPAFLGTFFVSGRAATDRPVELGEGLWPLLTWCWNLSQEERRGSSLCRRLIGDVGTGWRNEPDVLDAMARGLEDHDPSRLGFADVETMVGALLDEGEMVRGSLARFDLRLEFSLPRITSHPLYERRTIVEALQSGGLPGARVDEHLAAVHPERRPYRGAWRLSLRDRLRVVDEPEGPPSTATRDVVTIDDPEVGRRSRLELTLEYEADFAGYFRLSADGARAGRFPRPATLSQVSS